MSSITLSDPTVRLGREYMAAYARIVLAAYAALTVTALAARAGSPLLGAVALTAAIVVAAPAIMPRITAALTGAKWAGVAAQAVVAAVTVGLVAWRPAESASLISTLAIAAGFGMAAAFVASRPARAKAGLTWGGRR
jgi:hypothetical protein